MIDLQNGETKSGEVTIEELRIRLLWTQDDLSEKSGVTRSTISRIEKRKVVAFPSTMRKIADAFRAAGIDVLDSAFSHYIIGPDLPDEASKPIPFDDGDEEV